MDGTVTVETLTSGCTFRWLSFKRQTSKESSKTALSDAAMFAYLVTLAYGDVDVPTLAQVVFLSDREGEDASSVATSLLQNAEAQAPQMPRFDWTTLKVHGSQTLSQADLGRLVAAAAKGQVGVGRVSPLRLR